LVIKIQEGFSDEEALNQLKDAKNWKCNNDKLLLDELISIDNEQAVVPLTNGNTFSIPRQ